MIESLQPYVAFFILPLFAFVASGFPLRGVTSALLLSPTVLGIVAALFLGKQLGVFAVVFLTVSLKLGRKPTGATWLEIYGVSLLCGIGFTMSLFIGAMAFPSDAPQVRVGVLLGSLLSGAAGMAVLGWAGSRRRVAGQRDAS